MEYVYQFNNKEKKIVCIITYAQKTNKYCFVFGNKLLFLYTSLLVLRCCFHVHVRRSALGSINVYGLAVPQTYEQTKVSTVLLHRLFVQVNFHSNYRIFLICIFYKIRQRKTEKPLSQQATLLAFKKLTTGNRVADN